MKVAAIPAEAKEAARAAGLDDNQSALLAIAKAQDKVAAVAALVADRAERAATAKAEPPGYVTLRSAWDHASQAARDKLLAEIL